MASLASKALKAGAWYSVIRFTSQVLSWFFTIYTARLLSPEVFGLMAMASIFTMQMDRFSEMGFGVAIVQRKEVHPQELASIFWFLFLAGCCFAGLTLLLVYPTVWVFHEPRIKYVTALISPLFIIGAIGVVPLSIMKREFRFRAVGTIDFAAMLSSSLVTIWMALQGSGVYSLVVGLMVLRGIKSVLIFYVSGWRPQLIFSFTMIKPYLSFGVQVIMSGVLLRSLESLDKIIIGRFFSSSLLGVYGYAMSLAALPTEKIWPVFNEVLLTTLSKMQDDLEGVKNVALSTLKYFLYIITPILVGGSVFAEEIIVGILGLKWQAAVPYFSTFCISQLFFLIGVYFTVMNNSQGKPHRNLKYNFLSAITILCAVYFCARMGESYILLPWLVILPTLVCAWVWVNIRLHGLSFQKYILTLVHGVVPGVAVVLFLWFAKINFSSLWQGANLLWLVASELLIGAGLYVAYFAFFKRKDAETLINLVRNRG